MQKICIESGKILARAFREMVRVKRADRRQQGLDLTTLALPGFGRIRPGPAIGGQRLSGGTGVFQPAAFLDVA
jgi:hypothetical protein